MRIDLGQSGREVLQVVAVAAWLSVLVIGCGSITPAVTPEGPVESIEVPDSNALSRESAVQSDSVRITLGRAVLKPNGRVTVFYVTKDVSGKARGAVIIDSASITSSDARTWLADGYGELHNQTSLTLGWLTFPVSEATRGYLRITVNSVQTGAGPVTVPWQVEQLGGLIARGGFSETVIVDSGLCVSSVNAAIGFHEEACATEFVDPHAFRQEEITSEATRFVPRPTPTPTEFSTLPTRTPASQGTQTSVGDPALLFTVCTPWHFQLQVIIDNAEAPELGSSAPSTSTRCLLP